MDNTLTTTTFWSDYWLNLKVPISVDYGFKNDRVIAQSIKDAVQISPQDSVLEIGCAPGKWLSFFAKEYRCHVSGIEYIPEAANKTIENLKHQNIENFEILKADFFNSDIHKKFKTVMSFGFIEHFDNFNDVLDRHLSLIEPNGYLVIGIPRFVGVNYFMQKCIDVFIKNKLLPSHNLLTMNLQVFSDYATKRGLTLLKNEYIGGYEPGLFPVGQINNKPMRVILKIFNKVFGIFLGKINWYSTSSYQIAIMKKNVEL